MLAPLAVFKVKCIEPGLGKKGGAWRHMPVVPVLWEAEDED